MLFLSQMAPTLLITEKFLMPVKAACLMMLSVPLTAA